MLREVSPWYHQFGNRDIIVRDKNLQNSTSLNKTRGMPKKKHNKYTEQVRHVWERQTNRKNSNVLKEKIQRTKLATYQFQKISNISIIIYFFCCSMTKFDNLLCNFIARSRFPTNYANTRYNFPPIILVHILNEKKR